MAAPDPPPPDPAATPAPGDLFSTYNPQGAMGGLFAPAYIRGFAPSEQAVASWMAANRGQVTPATIDETRMPNLYTGAPAMSAGNGVYGGPIPMSQFYGDPRGAVDPEALRVLAQGGKYDLNARRNAIAARIAANRLAGGP